MLLAPTTRLCTLVRVQYFLYLLLRYLHQFSAVKYVSAENALFGAIWEKFTLYWVKI